MIHGAVAEEDVVDSGVPWLGEIARRWSLRRLWTLASVRKERNPGGLDLLSVFLDRGVIPYAEGGGQVHAPSLDLSKYQVVRPGDFVLNNQQAWRGSVGVSAHEGIISPAYIVLAMTPEVDPGFANYLLRSRPMVDQYVVASRGVGDIQRQVYWPHLRNVFLPLPSLEEQQAITRFLDYSARRIRRYIKAKRRLIALLNEQKAALVDRAVTRGLQNAPPPPDREITRSPRHIPWLFSAPAHWEIVRSKTLFTPRKERARPGDEQLSATQAYGVIPQAEFERREGRRVVKINLHLDKRLHVERDDFVISMRSFQGGLERAWSSGCIRSSYVVLKGSPEIDVEFFSYLFKSRAYIQALQATSNFIRDGQDLNFGNFCLVDLPLVPLAEQRAIAKSLAAETSGIRSAINTAQREIALLTSLRASLVADAVTGRLDVHCAPVPAAPPGDPGSSEDQDEAWDEEYTAAESPGAEDEVA